MPHNKIKENKRSEKQQKKTHKGQQGKETEVLQGARKGTCQGGYIYISTQARWICPEGTVPHGEPVPKQDWCQWEAYARAEEKPEKEGAAGRNYLALTVNTVPHTTWGGAQESGAQVQPGEGERKSVIFMSVFLS